MPAMDNMVFTARQPQINSINIEATVHNMDDVIVAKEHFADYVENVAVPFDLPPKIDNRNLIDNNLMDINFNEKPQSENESDELYDECYSCFMCNISYNTQVDLNAHLNTHTDDDTFHHSNINSISEPLPQSSIRPSKYYRCNECSKMYKSQLSYHEHMLIHTGEKPHHCWVCDRKFRHIANFRTHLKSHKDVRIFCSLCQKTIVGNKNYYIHYLDVHNNMSVRNPRSYQTSSSDSDEDFNPKVSYYKKKKITSRKFKKDNKQFGPLFTKNTWGKKKHQELENVNLDVEDEKSERETALETSRQDIQNMLQKRKQQQLNNYNTELPEEYKKRVESLILEKNSTGHINMSKLIGPLFWKNALIKAGLREKDIHPMQFQNRLRLSECTSCKKCFARLPQAQCTENNISPSKPPCSSCFMIKNESALNKHKLQVHTETPPFVCKECLLESDSWFNYVQHMKMHLKYAAKCSECVYIIMNKPDNVMFLCHVCEVSFDSDEKLSIHVQTHLENGQNNESSFN